MSTVVVIQKRMVRTRIAAQRAKRGMTQEQLAERLEMSQSSVAKWESGERIPDLVTLDDIAIILQCSVYDLIDDLRKKQVPTVGKIGAGSIVYAIETDAAQDYAPIPPMIEWRIDLCRLIVEGNSQEPMMFNGWHVYFYDDDRMQDGCENITSKIPHVIWLKDGRWLVKIVRKGYTNGKYNLHTLNSSDIIEDVEIEWCAPVAAIIPQ